MGFLKPPTPPAAPPPPVAAPMFGTPANKPPQRKAMAPTALGAQMTPSADLGAGGTERGHTLLGQA